MSLWDQAEDSPLTTMTTFNGVNLRCKWRRRPNFRDEAILIQGATEPATRRVDHLALLAAVVRDFVDDVEEQTGDGSEPDSEVWESLGLTPDRIQNDLPDRPALAWMLSEWLTGDILLHAAPAAAEVLRGKPGG